MLFPKERLAAASPLSDTHFAPRQPLGLATAEDIQTELETILDSPEFRGSHRGQMLLRYLVTNALEGGVGRLKERTIGVELFHREASYDTGQDAIVRVAANDIRKRLAAHYLHSDPAHTGSNIRISLAPGSYIPDFEFSERAESISVEESPAAPFVPALAARAWWFGGWRQTTLVVALAAICALLGVQNVLLHSASARPLHLTMLPWSQLAAPGSTVTLVVADVNFASYKSLVHADPPLPVYTSQRWIDDLATRMPSIIDLSRMPFTSIADAAISARIGSVLEGGACAISVRSGRVTQVGDFKSDRSVILLGSAYSNPWVGLLNDHLNFRIEYDPALGKQVCKNASPLPGESPVYIGTAHTPMPGVAYGTIALVPNLSHNGFVLIIAGTNMEGMEAAGEFVTDLPRLTGALRSRGINPAAKVEQLEILMRLDHMSAQSSRSEIIAHRVIQ